MCMWNLNTGISHVYCFGAVIDMAPKGSDFFNFEDSCPETSILVEEVLAVACLLHSKI